jgi:aminoglycoside phosphotransferase (APT) family kinase protein
VSASAEASLAARAHEVAAGLLDYLRTTLGAPRLDFAEFPSSLGGGFDTEIYAFRLRGAPARFGDRLVLRILRAHYDPAMVLREQATQNAVAAQGYPAPRVLLATRDPMPLGAAFAVMERAPGTPLTSRLVGMAAVLAEAQLRLHGLDLAPLRGTLPDLDGYLDALARRIDAASLAGLAPLLGWLRERRPRLDVAPVICHGDLHPQNVLVQGRAVSGVLDWPNAIVAEPAFDVAATLSILRFVPIDLVVSGLLRWPARVGLRILARRYVAGYQRRRSIDPARLTYYEIATALRALVRSGESRRRATGGPPPSALDRSPYAARLQAHAARVTGLAVSLP